MASAQGIQTYQGQMPSTNVSGVGSHHYDGSPYTGEGFGSQILKFFTGFDESQAYQNALTENNRAYEQAMLQSARDYETWFDATAVQRRVNDIKAAGLNPWLALQSGGIGANGSSSSSIQPGAGSSAKTGTSSSGRNGLSSLAMFLVSTARLLAVL